MRVDPDQIDMRAVSDVAEKHDLSTYDAAYIELALRREFGLITLDRDLAAAAANEGIAVQTPGHGSASQRRRRYNI